jgi:hypothetical protein
MHMSNFKHGFGVCLHILAQIIICWVHKVTKFTPWNVVKILWNEFQLNTFLQEFSCVAMALPFLSLYCLCCNPTLAKCEDETHTPKVGDLESSGTPKNSELDCRGQNTLHWGVLNIIGKVSKSRCPKWPRMSHLDICSPSYGQKKGRESKWQFDSQPLKVGNRPDPDVRWGSATWLWKDLEKSYNIGLELVRIGGRGEKLWSPKVLGAQTRTVSGLHFESPGTKNHLGVGAMEEHREYYTGEGGGFPRVRAVVS